MRLRLPWERICAQYGFGFFAPEKSKFVSSTASDRKGFVKGEARSPLTRFCLLLAVQKEAPAGQAYSLCLCKRLRDAEGDHKLAPAG